MPRPSPRAPPPLGSLALPRLRARAASRCRAVTQYTQAEAHMLKLIVARGLLDSLNRIRIGGRPAPSLASYHGIPYLHQFICAHHGLMAELDSDQKKLVSCLSDLVSDIDYHEGGLRKACEKWIAHLKDDKLADDVSGFFWHTGLPEDATWHREMSECAVAFVDIAQALLPDIAMPALEKLNGTHGARPDGHVFDPGRAPQSVRNRLVRAQKKAAEEYAGRPWPPLLEAVGIGPEPLGGDAS